MPLATHKPYLSLPLAPVAEGFQQNNLNLFIQNWLRMSQVHGLHLGYGQDYAPLLFPSSLGCSTDTATLGANYSALREEPTIKSNSKKCKKRTAEQIKAKNISTKESRDRIKQEVTDLCKKKKIKRSELRKIVKAQITKTTGGFTAENLIPRIEESIYKAELETINANIPIEQWAHACKELIDQPHFEFSESTPIYTHQGIPLNETGFILFKDTKRKITNSFHTAQNQKIRNAELVWLEQMEDNESNTTNSDNDIIYSPASPPSTLTQAEIMPVTNVESHTKVASRVLLMPSVDTVPTTIHSLTGQGEQISLNVPSPDQELKRHLLPPATQVWKSYDSLTVSSGSETES